MKLLVILLATLFLCIGIAVHATWSHAHYACEYAGIYTTYNYYGRHCDYHHYKWLAYEYPPFGAYSIYELYCCDEA